MEEAKYQTAARDAANKAYQGALTVDENGQPKFDSAAVTKSLYAAGFGAEAPTILEHMQKFEQGKATLEQTHANTQKLQSEAQTHQQDMMGNMGAAIKAAGNDPAMADTFLQHMEMTPDMPPEGKQRIEQLRQQMKQNPAMVGQMADNWISQSPAQQKRQLEQAKEAETARHNKAMEEKTPTTEAGLAERAAAGDQEAIKAIEILDKSKRESRPVTNIMTGNDAKDIADAIENGDQPPTLQGLYRNAGPVRAELARRGVPLAKMETDWKATQKYVSSLNSTQQVKLQQSISSASELLPKIDGIYNEWKKLAPVSGFKIANHAALVAMKNMPGRAGAVASALDTQIAELTADLGNIYMGGNSPTDQALKLGHQALQSDWGPEAFEEGLKQAKLNIGIRQNSMKHGSGPAGLSGTTNYAPGAGAEAPAAAPAPGGYQPLPSFKEWDAKRKAQAQP